MKTSVLHLRASNFVGGPEKQILGYSSVEEVNTIISTFCCANEGTELVREATSRGIATLAVPAHSLPQSVRAVANSVRESNVRLICAHGYKPAVVAMIVSKMTGVPYACFLRGATKENLKVAFYEAVERFCCRRADRIICLSETQAMRVGCLYAGRVRVVVNAAEVRNYNTAQRNEAKVQICTLAGLNPARPLVVAAGRLSPEKGANVLVDAAALLCKAQPDFQFVLFGDGVERERLRKRIAGLGLEPNFKLVGHHANFSDLVCGADLVVNPSLTEEMPNVVLEAMSAGVPVVATGVGGVPELGHDGAIALVSTGDANQIANATKRTLSDPATRLRMVDKALNRLRDDYSRARQTQQLRALYGEFLPMAQAARTRVLPSISIVIPVRNEEMSLPTVLAAFREQDYPSELFDIIVADGMSTDCTVEQVDRLASQPGVPIKLVQNLGRLSSAGRNAGVAAASGDIILFCDGHSHVPSRTLLRDVARLFSTTGADILCRPQPLNYPGTSRFQQIVAAARASWLGHGRDSTIYSTEFEGWVDPSSAGAIYRRDLFAKFGGFDENFDACEDVEFNHRLHRAGIKAYISPKLTIFYEPRKSLSSLFRQMIRYGRGRVRLARKYSGSSSVSQLAPAALLLLVIPGPLMLFTRFWGSWLAIMGVYLATVLFESLRLLRRLRVRALLLPPVFITIHSGLGAGLISEFFVGRRRPTPQVPSFFSTQDRSAAKLQVHSGASAAQEIGTT
jgi:succinoglycan biosynthesis protein ExoA